MDRYYATEHGVTDLDDTTAYHHLLDILIGPERTPT